MAGAIGSLMRSILDWASAADHRYREACKMMQLDDNILDDIGITREELMAEVGIDRLHGARIRALGRGEMSCWSSFAHRRVARGRV